MKKNILFIINPISGIGKQKVVEKLLEDHLDKDQFNVSINHTKGAKHAIELSRKGAATNDIIVAVGGDGSINEIARSLINTDTALGIIPSGSGNGLARFLHIPMKTIDAIRLLNNHQAKQIDTATINDEFFCNVAGVGFDAHVAHIFADFGKRGSLSYVRIIAREYRKYKAQTYNIHADGIDIRKKAFLISFANSSQFGNNGHIAPQALIDDGLLDICVVREFPSSAGPFLGYRLKNKTINKSKYIEKFKAKHLILTFPEPMKAHIDGEPIHFGTTIEINVLPKSLKVIVP